MKTVLGVLLAVAFAQATYLGCWVDDSQRSLTGYYEDLGQQNTVQACKQLCKSKGFKYSANQWSTQCFCGNHYDRYRQVPDSECNSRCPGERQQHCGGRWRNSVHSTEDVEESTKFYLGCWADNRDRALSGHSQDLGPESNIQQCRSLCQKKGYKYSGNQYGTQCFCGDSYDKHGKMSENECNTRCPGNRNQMCGGIWRNSVYTTNYVGCYRDSQTRDLEYFEEMLKPAASVDRCLTICANRGYRYAGVQYHNQCYCGNRFNSYGEVSRSECNTPCSGNPNQKCGGTWRNSIYRVK